MKNLSHHEPHYSTRNNWLRAAVLGANDGLISTASLLMGVAAGNLSKEVLLLTGIASLIAGAISMAAGEYVSVSSQADTEKADLAKEAYELEHNSEIELAELTNIYKGRGLDDELALQVAKALTAHNALEAHAKDEIGIVHDNTNPLQAALASAAAFMVGASLPIVCILVSTSSQLVAVLAVSTLVGLGLLGFVSAKLGGAKVAPAVLRVLTWGVIALLTTHFVGKFFGVGVA